MRVEFEHLVVEKSDDVARVTLDRPERRNAMHYPAASELDAVSQLLADDRDVRLVAIQGAGPSFCSGMGSGGERAVRRSTDLDRLAQVVRVPDSGSGPDSGSLTYACR